MRAYSLEIADHFRDRIISGNLSPGARLPAEYAVAEQWSTTRTTAVQALRVLHAGLAGVQRPHHKRSEPGTTDGER